MSAGAGLVDDARRTRASTQTARLARWTQVESAMSGALLVMRNMLGRALRARRGYLRVSAQTGRGPGR